MNLNMDQWKEFRIGDIFECSTTKLSIKDELDIWNIPLISRTAMNNWCDGYFDIDPQKVSYWGCITIGAEGIYAFYQAKDFWTWNKVYTIKNKEMNQYSALFICTLLNKEDYKYSYWRARILGKLINETFKLPVNPEWNPDREFMENYIKSLHSKPITTKNKPWKNVFHTDEWKEFRIGDLFDVQLSKWDIKLDEVDKWNIPLISSWESNNGIVWVQGEAGAKSFLLAPNQSVLLMDSENNVFYIKSSDGSGMPLPLRIFDYTERKQKQEGSQSSEEYITRKEFEKRLSELKNAKQSVQSIK